MQPSVGSRECRGSTCLPRTSPAASSTTCGRDRLELGRAARAARGRVRAELAGAGRSAARARALERDRRAAPRARRARDRPRRRGRLLLADLLGEREPDSLRRRDAGLRRRERGDLDARPRAARAGARRAAADQARSSPSTSTASAATTTRSARSAPRAAWPSSRTRPSRSARPTATQPAGGQGDLAVVLLQRQQGDHDERRRDARLARRRVDRARAQALDAGARARAALRAHRDRLQLPAQQPAGRGRPCPARGAARSASTPGGGSTPATASCSPDVEFMPEAAVRRRATAGSPASLDFGPTPSASGSPSRQEDIESRPLWKPMHLQPVFADVAGLRRRGLGAALRARASACRAGRRWRTTTSAAWSRSLLATRA